MKMIHPRGMLAILAVPVLAALCQPVPPVRAGESASPADAPAAERRTGGVQHAHRPPVSGTTILGVLGQGSPNHAFTTGIQAGRLFRDGIQPTCDDPKTTGGMFAFEDRAYDAYTLRNLSAAPVCAVVSYRHFGEVDTFPLFLVAYSGGPGNSNPYDPSAPENNWLSDSGSSANSDGDLTFSFQVPAAAAVVFVVHEVNPGEGTGVGYSLNVQGLVDGDLLLQDPRSPGKKLFIDRATGQFLAVCGGLVSGSGVVRVRGATLTLSASVPGSRVFASVDLRRRRAVVSVSGRGRCGFLDPNVDDNDPSIAVD